MGQIVEIENQKVLYPFRQSWGPAYILRTPEDEATARCLIKRGEELFLFGMMGIFVIGSLTNHQVSSLLGMIALTFWVKDWQYRPLISRLSLYQDISGQPFWKRQPLLTLFGLWLFVAGVIFVSINMTVAQGDDSSMCSFLDWLLRHV